MEHILSVEVAVNGYIQKRDGVYGRYAIGVDGVQILTQALLCGI